jgi:opacity protein-like surface antigen
VRAVALVGCVTAPALGAAGGAAGGTSTPPAADRVEDETLVSAERPERHVTVMPVAGFWNHPFERSGWKAKPGPVVGLDVKVEPLSWLGIRASFLRGHQPLDSGSLAQGVSVGAQGTTADQSYTTDQPMLKITQLGLRVEPTLRFSRAWAGYLGAGITWGHVEAPETVTAPRLRSFDRTAVHVGYEGAIGIAYEPLVDWIVFDLSLAGAWLGKQTGTAYDTVQAFSEDGHRTQLGGLPHFDGVMRVMFGVGLVL